MINIENKTSKIIKLAIASVAFAAVPALAQDAMGPQKREATYTVALNQDSFFGFAPSFNGAIPVNETTDFTFYGIFWTRPSFNLVGGNNGDGLWTEFGVGANFHLMDGALKVKPQIGLTNGSLLSGGAQGAGGPEGARFADGIVPSLTVNYSDDKFEGELYAGYYAALRQRNDAAALDFLHLWVNAGYKFSSLVSAGVHYELLSNTRTTYPGGQAAAVYEWVGPYVQFTLPKGMFARFTAGPDTRKNNGRGDFYKMSVGMSF
jgi:hypothetical protein